MSFSYAGASLHAIKAILTVKRHRSNRIVALCYYSVSRLSHKAFLTPFRMTIEGESVMMRGTIRRHNEGNVNRHPERM